MPSRHVTAQHFTSIMSQDLEDIEVRNRHVQEMSGTFPTKCIVRIQNNRKNTSWELLGQWRCATHQWKAHLCSVVVWGEGSQSSVKLSGDFCLTSTIIPGIPLFSFVSGLSALRTWENMLSFLAYWFKFHQQIDTQTFGPSRKNLWPSISITIQSLFLFFISISIQSLFLFIWCSFALYDYLYIIMRHDSLMTQETVLLGP
jgi:hypothetical protein